MKTLYHRITLVLLHIPLVAFMLACSQDLSYQEALTKNERKIDDKEKLGDANFLVEARSLNMLQARLAEIASTSGYSSTIVSLARGFVKDQEDLGEDIEDLARKEKIKLPTAMDEQHNRLLNEVSSSDREDFDKNFLRILKQVNADNTYAYTNMATEASDPDVRAFTARKLDLLRLHAQKIEEAEKNLLNTY